MSPFSCPRCNTKLSPAGAGLSGAAVSVSQECHTCGGLFLDRGTADLLTPERAAEIGALLVRPGDRAAPESSHAIVYLSCPACGQLMNRINFAKRSGVIVDQCRTHGTWFDAGELRRAIEFVQSSRYERTRKKDLADEEESRRQELLRKIGADARLDTAHLALTSREHQRVAIADAILSFLFS